MANLQELSTATVRRYDIQVILLQAIFQAKMLPTQPRELYGSIWHLSFGSYEGPTQARRTTVTTVHRFRRRSPIDLFLRASGCNPLLFLLGQGHKRSKIRGRYGSYIGPGFWQSGTNRRAEKSDRSHPKKKITQEASVPALPLCTVLGESIEYPWRGNAIANSSVLSVTRM